MRILQVTPFYPPHVGGIEFHVESLSRKLVEAGHKVVAYTSNIPKAKGFEIVHGVEVHRFRSPLSPLNNPLMPWLFPKLLGDTNFDVVHAHGHFHMTSTLAVLAGVLARRPVVLTSHGAILGYQGARRLVESVFNASLGKWTLNSADKVIALSPSQADILAKLGAKRNSIAVIPSWVNLGEVGREADAADFRNKYGLGDRKIVLFVGRLLPIKGLEYLIEAAKYAQTKPAVVIVGGEAPGYSGTRQSLEHRARELGLERDVLFLGEFPKEGLAAAYAGGDVFVLPSLGEGMPLALLEAMSVGKCVLATDVPGNRDVVKDGQNGLLVEPRNSVQLALNIDYLLGDEALRHRLGMQARQDIEREYNPDAVMAKMLELYREMQGKRQQT